jgi:WS/DGAT/MGAT family acyltransferase
MIPDRLTALDASFVWFERPGVPLHVGGVATFEAGPLTGPSGRLRLDDIRDQVSARLDALPRMRRRLAAVPLDVDRPYWVDDPDFDIARHVREVPLPPPGDEDALRRLAGELLSQVLPRDRPLWDLVFVTGLDGGRVGLVERVHHALVDGVSGVELATLLLDLEPDAPPAHGSAWAPDPAPDGESLLAASLRRGLALPLRAAGAVAGLARHPTGAARTARTVAGGLVPLFLDGLLAPRSSLNAPLAGARRLAWVRAGVDDARRAGRPADATLNDVVLAAVAGGLRHLALERGERLPAGAELKVLVPVSRHVGPGDGSLGNRVSALAVPLPIGIGDPRRRLAAIAAGTRQRKAGPEADAVGMILDAADHLPAAAARTLTRSLDHQRFVNLVVTNVPGPPVPLYARGARMLEAFPVVPLLANFTVGVAVLSYDGALTVTLTADDVACPDVDVFAAGIEQAFAQLGVEPRAAGAPPGRRNP